MFWIHHSQSILSKERHSQSPPQKKLKIDSRNYLEVTG